MPQSPSPQSINQVRKLSKLAEALRQGNKFHVTRLLCASILDMGTG
jgi:hypothetical protein